MTLELPGIQDGEIWYLYSPWDEGAVIFGSHRRDMCSVKEACAIHHPSNHWARNLPQKWEFTAGTGGAMYRECEHGILHDDPDDSAYRARHGAGPAKVRLTRCPCSCPCTCEVTTP